MENTQRIPVRSFPLAVLAFGSGGAVSPIRAKNVTLSAGRYAQYPNALYVTYTEKGKRKSRTSVLTYSPSLVVLRPDAGIEETLKQAFTDAPTLDGGMMVSRSRFSMFSPGWEKEWRETMLAPMVKAGTAVVLFDAKDWNASADVPGGM